MSTPQKAEANSPVAWSPRPWLDHHRLEPTRELERVLNSRNRDDLPQIVNTLISAGAHPDGPARNGIFLRHAVSRVNLPLLHQLLKHGADPNARLISDRHEVPVDRQRALHNNIETVLQWAIVCSGVEARRFNEERSLAMMLHLICAGADPKAESRFGMTCLEIANAEADLSPKSTNARMIPLAIELPFHVAIELNNPELCMSLLETGANPELKNPRKQTAWRAAQLRAPECLAAMQSWLAQQTMRDIAAISNRTRSP